MPSKNTRALKFRGSNPKLAFYISANAITRTAKRRANRSLENNSPITNHDL